MVGIELSFIFDVCFSASEPILSADEGTFLFEVFLRMAEKLFDLI